LPSQSAAKWGELLAIDYAVYAKYSFFLSGHKVINSEIVAHLMSSESFSSHKAPSPFAIFYCSLTKAGVWTTCPSHTCDWQQMAKIQTCI